MIIMKKLSTLFMMLSIAFFSHAQVNVTINIDMSDVADFDSATRQLDFAGAFDGWAEFHPLTHASGDIYTVTFTDIATGFYGGDVYHNAIGAPAWGTYGEWSGAPTGIDIMVYVGEEDVTVNTKWGATYNMSCSVDMNDVAEFNSATDSVYYMSPEVGPISLAAMADADGDGIYSVTFEGIPSGLFPTVFAYGPDADNLTTEWNYETNKGQRVISVENEDFNDSFVFAAIPSSLPSVTINVDMSDVADFDSATRQIDFAGAFDGWAAFHSLTHSSGDIYSVTFTDVAPGFYGGDVYHNNIGEPAWGTYGEWSGSPTGIDIMVYVGEEDVTVNTKWGATYTMTCNIDMNGVADFDAATDTVYYMSPEVGPLSIAAMTDADGDGIYSVTFEGIPSGLFPTVFAYGPDADNLTTEWDYDANKGLRVVSVENTDFEGTFVFGLLTDVKDNVALPEISLYPNPTSGKFIVEVEIPGKVDIMDYTGKVIYSKPVNNNLNTIDITGNPKGYYIARFTTEDKSVSYKLILQ
jgi:hypothetical protein